MVSCFARQECIGNVNSSLPELTQTLTILCTAPDHIDEDAMHTVDRFIIPPYGRTNTATDIVKARHNDANCLQRKAMSS